jgi:hypothetical protein
MTTLEQAARQALEALEDYRYRGAPFACIPAINALQQALEQPKQEPAGWQWMGTGHYRKHLPKDAEKYCWKPLYTEQPKREWVGLTDVEIGDALIDLPVLGNGYFLRIARAIEAKLKELNQCDGSANGSSHERA